MNNFDEILEKVLYKLKDKYPRYDIKFNFLKENKATLTCDNKKLYTFDPIFLRKETEFLENNPDYHKFVFNFFDEHLSEYYRKEAKRIKKGRYSTGLTLQEVQNAILNTKSNGQASRYLNVSYNTWKKYASLYKDENGISLFEKHLNPSGIGIERGITERLGKYKLQDIIDGKAPASYPAFRFKNRLVKSGFIIEKCSNCGFEERRLGDGKMPLMIDFIDGNPLNRSLENLRLLCYNCYYLVVGEIFWRKKGDFSPPHNTKHKEEHFNSKEVIKNEDFRA